LGAVRHIRLPFRRMSDLGHGQNARPISLETNAWPRRFIHP
jgi:hypothetical protein